MKTWNGFYKNPGHVMHRHNGGLAHGRVMLLGGGKKESERQWLPDPHIPTIILLLFIGMSRLSRKATNDWSAILRLAKRPAESR